METLITLKSFAGRPLLDFPRLTYSGLYRRLRENFHLEIFVKGENFLLSPFYTVLRGLPDEEFERFVRDNEEFLDSLKEFILASLFVYSAAIEENAYYLSSDKDVFIARLILREECRFEVKLYAHHQDELALAYDDKIYLGRIFVDLQKFHRDHFGLREYFLSILEQNSKIQERARLKLANYEAYRKADLEEIDYLAKEATSAAIDRLNVFPRVELKKIPTVRLDEMIDDLLHIQNLMIELRDCAQEFENRLHQRDESLFAKHLTKYAKDLVNDIKYLTKINMVLSLRLAHYNYF